jgi:hypothetical protein
LPLQFAFETGDSFYPFEKMLLTNAAVHALSPEIKTASFQISAHERYHL